MAKAIKIKKGLDIPLEGKPELQASPARRSKLFAVKPPDFHGLTPKLLVQQGDEVKAGSPLFYDKKNEEIIFCSPVSGEVVEVERGAKRRILAIKILADKEVAYLDHGAAEPATLSREQVIEKLLKSGCWPFVRQRPFSVIANPAQMPKSVFVSAVDTAPLAPDIPFVIKDEMPAFETGLRAIKQLTEGPLHLNVSADDTQLSKVTPFEGLEINTVKGPHPAGNVGVQIHQLDPLNKGEVIWYVTPQDVLAIGRLFLSGKFDLRRTLALTGSEVEAPQYYETIAGAQVSSITEGKLKDGELRIISGNVLTGTRVEADGFLGYYDIQLSVIPEGNELKFFLTDGWLSPGLKKFSMSRAYPSWLMPKKTYRLDTNQNGEERAYVMTGQYEKVFPFDIFPVLLIKAILVNDIDRMEQLGIYEVDAEDFALCEFVCTSKVEVQRIVREGLDTLRAEVS